MVDHAGENSLAVMPLFVAITPGMEIMFEGGREVDDGGGGPKRSTAQEFAINKETMTGPDPG
jgi:hypothetical protein